MWLLHLGIASLMSLGPFSYAMLAFSILLLRPADWDSLARWQIARRTRGTVRRLSLGLRSVVTAHVPGAAVLRPWTRQRSMAWRPTPRLSTVLREAVAMVLFVAMLAELTLANPVVPESFRWTSRPDFMAEILYYLRVYQTWGMFSADVPTSDGGLVVDALLADGSRVDLLTGRSPNLDAPLHGPYGLDHDWSEYMFYYPWDRHRTFRAGLRDYLVRRHQQRVTAAEKRLRSFDIYWVTADCPPPGQRQPRNIKRELMISYVAEP